MRAVLALGIATLAGQFFGVRDAFAGPILLSLDITASNVSVGEIFDVELNISGLEPEDLGGFDLDLTFDPAVVQYQSYSLGTELADAFFGGPIDLSDDSRTDTGVLQLAEVSGLFDFSAQPSAFLLATVTFLAQQRGLSPLTISKAELSDSTGLMSLAIDEINGASVAVPTPSTLLLLPFGIALLFARRPQVRQ